MKKFIDIKRKSKKKIEIGKVGNFSKTNEHFLSKIFRILIFFSGREITTSNPSSVTSKEKEGFRCKLFVSKSIYSFQF